MRALKRLGMRPVAAAAGGAVLWMLQVLPASAHPATGGSSSGGQIAVAAAGGLVVFVGLAALVIASKGPGEQGRRSSRLRLVGVAAIFGGLLVFIVGPDLVPARSSAACTRPTTNARLAIVSPAEGDVVPAGKVPVEVSLTGGKLAGVGSTTNTAGEGHLHLALDGRLVSMTGEATQTVELPPGEHTLTAEYVANDHAPFCRRVTARRRITAGG
jgi:hypothetical protein